MSFLNRDLNPNDINHINLESLLSEKEKFQNSQNRILRTLKTYEVNSPASNFPQISFY